MTTRTFSLVEATPLGATSFTLPVDYESTGTLTVLCIGGGGGGARRANSSGGGGGGGGGALARGSFSNLKPGQVIYFSVGGAGAGGTTAGGQNGGNGGDSWININSNAAPSSTSDGVLAKGGTGATAGAGGNGGAAASCIGSLGTASGGNGGTGGASNGSGGGGGGAAGRYSFADNTYGTGGTGGNGFNVAGDGGGGGGGGVIGNGNNATSITGATGGTGFGSAAGGATNSNATNPGAGGGGGSGVNVDGGFANGGGASAANLVALSGALVSNYGYSSGGGGGGGGSNNSTSNGGGGGFGIGTDAAGSTRAWGGGGGGGGSGVGNSGFGGNGGSGLIIITYDSKETMLPTSSLSFNAIQNYFGGSNPISLTEYYRGSTVTSIVSPYAKNNAGTLIPASGQISTNNFRGAPFKLYRQVDAGALISVSKFFTSIQSGYDSATSLGSISSTAFTLSGGANVSIATLTKQNLGNLVFRVTSTSAVSNSGWDYMIIDEARSCVYARSDAQFDVSPNAGTWTWTGTLVDSIFDLGSDFVVKFV